MFFAKLCLTMVEDETGDEMDIYVKVGAEDLNEFFRTLLIMYDDIICDFPTWLLDYVSIEELEI